MKQITIILLAAMLAVGCEKENVHIQPNADATASYATAEKYEIAYAAQYNGTSMHDGIVLVSCSLPVSASEAKVLVQRTIFALENIKLDIATMTIIEIKKFEGDPSDAGYRDAGLSCGCDNQQPAKNAVTL